MAVDPSVADTNHLEIAPRSEWMIVHTFLQEVFPLHNYSWIMIETRTVVARNFSMINIPGAFFCSPRGCRRLSFGLCNSWLVATRTCAKESRLDPRIQRRRAHLQHGAWSKGRDERPLSSGQAWMAPRRFVVHIWDVPNFQRCQEHDENLFWGALLRCPLDFLSMQIPSVMGKYM